MRMDPVPAHPAANRLAAFRLPGVANRHTPAAEICGARRTAGGVGWGGGQWCACSQGKFRSRLTPRNHGPELYAEL